MVWVDQKRFNREFSFINWRFSATEQHGPNERQSKAENWHLIEIIPIKKYNSFEYTRWRVILLFQFAGLFVLLFDNSFSIGTSKHLFYHAYLSTDIVPSPSATPQLSSGQNWQFIAAGWISKRRSGMVRSWSRRWFQLDSFGSFELLWGPASPLKRINFRPRLLLGDCKEEFEILFGFRESRRSTFASVQEGRIWFWIQVLSSFKHFGPLRLWIQSTASEP